MRNIYWIVAYLFLFVFFGSPLPLSCILHDMENTFYSNVLVFIRCWIGLLFHLVTMWDLSVWDINNLWFCFQVGNWLRFFFLCSFGGINTWLVDEVCKIYHFWVFHVCLLINQPVINSDLDRDAKWLLTELYSLQYYSTFYTIIKSVPCSSSKAISSICQAKLLLWFSSKSSSTKN